MSEPYRGWDGTPYLTENDARISLDEAAAIYMEVCPWSSFSWPPAWEPIRKRGSRRIPRKLKKRAPWLRT